MSLHLASRLVWWVAGACVAQSLWAATLESAPSPAVPGRTVTLKGQAKPNTFMSFYLLVGGKQMPVGVAQVGAQGQYTHSFALPADMSPGEAKLTGGCDKCGNGWTVFPLKIAGAGASPAPDPGRFRAGVEAAYLEWFGRGPDARELEHWTGLLARGQATEASMRQSLQAHLKQQERDAAITRSYQEVFKRAPNEGELNAWRGAVAAGHSYASMVKSHRDYLAKNPPSQPPVAAPAPGVAPDPGRYRVGVEAAYLEWFGRGPDARELEHWTGFLARGQGTEVSMRQSLQAHLKQQERDAAITRSYQEVFKRAPNEGELNAWRGAVAAGHSYASMVKSHRDYLAKNPPSQPPVSALPPPAPARVLSAPAPAAPKPQAPVPAAPPPAPAPMLSARPAQQAVEAKAVECTADAAKGVLGEVFGLDVRTYPSLSQIFGDPNSKPVQSAIGDCLEGREGGGRAGMLKWVSKNKKWYWDNTGMGTLAKALEEARANKLAECKPLAASAALFAAFDKERAIYPSLETMFRDANSAAVQAAIADCQAGVEGGGRDGMLAWIAKPETKKHYWGAYGFKAHVLSNECKPSQIRDAFRKLFQQEADKSPALNAYFFEGDRSPLVVYFHDVVCSKNVQAGFAVGLSTLFEPQFSVKIKEWYWDNFIAQVVRVPMIRTAHMDAFGRGPSADEMKRWTSSPANEPAMASPTALFDALLNVLKEKQSVPEQQATVKRALDVVFKNERAGNPRLQAYLDDVNNNPIKFAIGALLGGHEGGGYRGVLAYIIKPATKEWYLKNAGIYTVIREPMIRTAYMDAYGRQPSPDELTYWLASLANDPSMASPVALFNAHLNYLKHSVLEQQATVKRALDVVFKNERAGNPGLQAYLDNANNNPIKFAIGALLGGHEGGGYRGVLAYIIKPATKEWYLKNAGIQAASLAPVAAGVGKSYSVGIIPSEEEQCAASMSGLYAFDGTDTQAKHESPIWQVFTRFQGIGNCGDPNDPNKFYLKGPGGAGAESLDLLEQMFRFACPNIKDKKIKKVFVIGFSRGAINAIRFTNELESRCGVKDLKVTFLGASDPVDALMIGYDNGKTLQPGKAVHSLKLIKSRDQEWSWYAPDNYFITAGTKGFDKTEVVKDDKGEQSSSKGNTDRHWMMNASDCDSGRKVEERFILAMKQMTKLDVRFGKPQLIHSEAGNNFETCRVK